MEYVTMTRGRLLRLTGAKGWYLTKRLFSDLYEDHFDYFEVAFLRDRTHLDGSGYDVYCENCAKLDEDCDCPCCEDCGQYEHNCHCDPDYNECAYFDEVDGITADYLCSDCGDVAYDCDCDYDPDQILDLEEEIDRMAELMREGRI